MPAALCKAWKEFYKLCFTGSQHITCQCLIVLMLCMQPSLASLLIKPKMGMHDSIFEYNGGNKRKLHSYFPDPTTDIDNKVSSQQHDCLHCSVPAARTHCCISMHRTAVWCSMHLDCAWWSEHRAHSRLSCKRAYSRSGRRAHLAAVCRFLMAALCMQLGLATSLLKYKPDMHESWVDPKVRQLRSRPVIRMRSSGLPLFCS